MSTRREGAWARAGMISGAGASARCTRPAPVAIARRTPPRIPARRCALRHSRRAAGPGCGRWPVPARGRPARDRAPAAPGRTDRRPAAACPARCRCRCRAPGRRRPRLRPRPTRRSRPRLGVLGGIGEQVGQDLRQSITIAVDDEAGAGHADLQGVALLLEERDWRSRSPCPRHPPTPAAAAAAAPCRG